MSSSTVRFDGGFIGTVIVRLSKIHEFFKRRHFFIKLLWNINAQMFGKCLVVTNILVFLAELLTCIINILDVTNIIYNERTNEWMNAWMYEWTAECLDGYLFICCFHMKKYCMTAYFSVKLPTWKNEKVWLFLMLWQNHYIRVATRTTIAIRIAENQCRQQLTITA